MKFSSITLAAVALALASSAFAQEAPRGEGTRPGESTDGMAMQKARGDMMSTRGQKVAYTKAFDLSGLPTYKPRHQVSGTIRIWGSNYIVDGNVGKYWLEGFRKFHPNVKIEWNMKTTSAAVPSLVFGVSDMGMGRSVTFSELQMFQRYKNHDPLAVVIATGSYDVPGWNPGFGVIVNKDNPLSQISLDQLDGIFGSERAGGWEGTTWHPEWARGPEKNIRTWGDLGLKGEWANKPINVYGLNQRYHQSAEISDWILKGSDKWNEKLRIYANYVTADGKLARNMNEDLAADKYGIGIVAAPTTTLMGGKAMTTQKILPVGRTAAGPFVAYTLETLQDRSYPLTDEIYAFSDTGKDGTPNPAVTEFMRFIVSREGQEAVMRDGKYLPMNAKLAREQLAKLDDSAGGN